MKDYAQYSFWLEHAGDLTPRPALEESISVDVAILGAGFTGLWTAYHLLQRDPSLKVVVLEAEIAGFGASGRNGGWCFAGFPYPNEAMTAEYGVEAARQVMLEMYRAVDDVGEVCAREGIDAHFHKGGELEIARADYDLPTLQKMHDSFAKIGLENHYQLLDQRETEARIRVPRALGSVWNREGARVQPARLARGLAEAVERHGGVIYEQTRVTDFVPGPLPRFDTARGNVSARTIVLAGEAYLAQQPRLRRVIIPITSHMVATEPLTAEQWATIGWDNKEVLGGFGSLNGYINHTEDGRIAFGAYRGRYPFNSEISDKLDKPEDIFIHAREAARDWFPVLTEQNVAFTHAWGGVLGVPRDHMPLMTYDRASGVATGRGYSGEGVATANLSGRVLADLITEQDSDLTRLPMTRHQERLWEPEPIRWTGVQSVRQLRQRAIAETERTGARPDKPSLMQRVVTRLWES